jgi:hypothetical protein
LRNVEFRIGGPLKFVFRQPPEVTLANCLLLGGAIHRDQRAYGVGQRANPYRGSELSEDLRVHGDEVEEGAHPLVECPEGAPGERGRRRVKIALPQQLQDM